MIYAKPILVGAFTIEIDGETITWDVSTIKADALAGKFGPPVRLPMKIAPPNYAAGLLDLRKVEEMKRYPLVLNEPALAIGAPPVAGYKTHILCFVDGNHRLTARWENKMRTFDTFVVPHDQERNYRVDRSDFFVLS